MDVNTAGEVKNVNLSAANEILERKYFWQI